MAAISNSAIQIAGKAASAVPKLPKYENLSEWEDKFVPLKRLLCCGSRGHEDGLKICDGHLKSSSTSVTWSPRLLENEVFYVPVLLKLMWLV